MKKGAIRSEFSDAARSYDQYAVVQSYVFDTLTSLIVDNQPRRILDIGCGTGLHTARLAARFPDAEITAIDMSDQMIEVASQQVLPSNVSRTSRCDQRGPRERNSFGVRVFFRRQSNSSGHG
ncbi:methyltransferase domain-containing protein [bacterium]|nr:methyltransferase domain-containing protein [bacterium]